MRWIASAIRLMRRSRASQVAPTAASWATARASCASSTRYRLSRPAGVTVHQPGAVEHGEMLGHRLPRHRQLLAERGGRAVPSASSRSSIRRRVGSPIADQSSSSTVTLIGAATSRATYSRQARDEVIPPLDVVLVRLLEHGRLPAPLAEPGLGHPQPRALPRRLRSKVTSSELLASGSSLFVDPAEREQPRWLDFDDLIGSTFAARPAGPEDDLARRAGRGLDLRLVGPPLAGGAPAG